MKNNLVRICVYVSDELATRLTSIVKYKINCTKSLYIREALETALYNDEQWRANMTRDLLDIISEISPVKSPEEIEALRKEIK